MNNQKHISRTRRSSLLNLKNKPPLVVRRTDRKKKRRRETNNVNPVGEPPQKRVSNKEARQQKDGQKDGVDRPMTKANVPKENVQQGVSTEETVSVYIGDVYDIQRNTINEQMGSNIAASHTEDQIRPNGNVVKHEDVNYSVANNGKEIIHNANAM